MSINRRQFLGTSVGASVLLLPFDLQAQSPSESDPVLEQIMADLSELKKEGDAKPGNRKGSFRGIEALTGVIATHYGKTYDQDLKRKIKQLGRKRTAFVQDVVTSVNKPEFTHEVAELMLTRLEKEGLSGIMRDVQRKMRRLRENTPVDILPVRASMQYDFCSDLIWMIQLMEGVTAIACGFAGLQLGLNIGANITCASLTMQLGIYYSLRWWYGC